MTLPPAALEHFRAAVGAGTLDPGSGVGEGRAGAPEAAAEVVVTVRVEAGRVAEVGWECFGGPAPIAALSWLAQRLPGESVTSARAWRGPALLEALALPARERTALLLVEDALLQALDAAGH